MLQLQVLQTLISRAFLNTSGSRFRFTETNIIKNGKTFGSFILQEEEDKVLMVITTDETGSVPFVLTISEEPGQAIRICLFRRDETTSAIELVAE